MIGKAIAAAFVAGCVAACVWLPAVQAIRVVPAAVVVVGIFLLVRHHLVAVAYERKPRVWRAEYHAESAPSQVEIARQVARAQADAERPNRLECGGLGRCRVGSRRSA